MTERVPTVTVIVPVFNDVDRLRTCLARIAAQDYAGLTTVIVVDNRSSIDLRPALPAGDDRFRLIREEQRGSYAARNAALPLVDTDYIAFTDADCRPQPAWLSAAIGRLRAVDLPDAVGGDIHLVFERSDDPTTGPELYESAHEFDQRQFVESLGFAATANLVVTRDILDRVGPFNADLQSGGDDDWGHRLHAAGGRMVYCADAVVDHPARSTWPELTKKAVRVAEGMAGLTQGQAPAEDLRYLYREARLGAATWISIWRRERPDSAGAKVRYAAALSWVSLLRCTVRVRQRWMPRKAI
ncbi:hypothetical protein BOH66_13855 [Microbacterium aurum]|uniref:Glycosyltransferase 2-like domain-containing protein n=1 Tax=Microbacterium aurum TaxID=36805 RepID=A0A1P8UAR7_9MICO|nr:glycosyltransferase family A protein [Microbacterium aurum]APZ35209.1 hypothetical protein BOH66_13855 [Microbacterium aurum]MBM7829186.1 glycosyltransferase involved in cell wall biosynthesis [Microbacterium aurum]